MRDSTDHLEKYRQTGGSMPSDKSMGFNGIFLVPIDNRSYLQIICSDGMGWDHVSATVSFTGSTTGLSQTRIPRYEELCRIKDLFWKEEEAVFHLFPPKSDHVNNHPHVLHLWRPNEQDFPLPPMFMV